ncbi:p115 like vesicle tethering protein [Hysterangium stoloniferum]|nr:p115 like vesicle tethering protein [Hysterangium stoloniferum]
MDFISQTYNALKGPAGAPQTAVETIRRLADRLSQDTLLSDRRAAVLSLKGLSRDCKSDVGEVALLGLLDTLEKDTDIDADIAKAVLETLTTLCEVGGTEAAADNAPSGKDVGMKHTDTVLSTPQAANKLFHLLGDQTFYTRFGTLQLLQVLLQNRKTAVQNYFIKSSVGFSNVVLVLEDKREIIRNEGLLMLQSIITQNAEIQKILAFEGAFEKLLNIIHSDGGIEGGIVVQDSLKCMDGLLRFNVSNQSYFRETSLLPHITPLLLFPSNLPPTTPAPQEFALQFWELQKTINASLVVGILGMLIGSKGGSTNEQHLIIRCLLELALASNAPTSIKIRALRILPTAPVSPTALVTPYQPVPETNGEEWDRLEPVTPLDALVNNAVLGEYGGVNDAPDNRKRDALEFRALSLNVFENFIQQEETKLGVIRGMLPPDPSVEKQTSIAALNLLNTLATLPASPLTPSTCNRIHIATLTLASLLRFSIPAKLLAQTVVPNLAAQVPPTPGVGGGFFVPADDVGIKELAGQSEDTDANTDDRPQTLLQTLTEHLSLSFLSRTRAVETGDGLEEREWDRLIVGYLSLLSQWLWGNPSAVREFVESGGLSVLVEPINQTSGMDVLVQGLCSFLLAISYEFNREPGEITRHTIHAILNRLSPDALIARMARARDDERFKAIGPDTIVLPYAASQALPLSHTTAKDAEGEIWFDWGFVEFWKSNFYSMQRAVNTAPDALSASSIENPEQAAVISSLRDMIHRQASELDDLRALANRPPTFGDKPETLALVASLQQQLESNSEEMNKLNAQLAEANHAYESVEEAKREADKEQEDLLVFLEELSGKRRRDKARMREAGMDVSDDEIEEGEE